MKTKYFLAAALLVVNPANCPAEDIVTLDGHKYENVTDLTVKPDAITFTAKYGAGVGMVRVPFKNLSDVYKKKYNYDPFEESLFIAEKNHPVKITMDMAFRVTNIKAAMVKAKAEKKAVGFVLVWDEILNKPCRPMERGSISALAHFYTAFNDNMVLVFVKHNEDELGQVPNSVRTSFLGWQEAAFAPRIAVVSNESSQLICEITYGGDDATGQDREQILRQKFDEVKQSMEGK